MSQAQIMQEVAITHPLILKQTPPLLLILSLHFKKLQMGNFVNVINFIVLCYRTSFQGVIQSLPPQANQSGRTIIKYLQGLFHANKLLQKMGSDGLDFAYI